VGQDIGIAKSCLMLLDLSGRERHMRTSKTLSITLPPEMLARAAEIAKQEHRTMSELVREALREYERNRQWDEMNAYGQARARELGLTEADVEPAVRAVREERRKRQSLKPKK
jgi:CopG family transcriptional regulator/antitoxin EndoAI